MHSKVYPGLVSQARQLPQWVWLARLGIDNTLADALSRNNATLFLSKVPSTDKTATHVLQELSSRKLMELLASGPKARLDHPRTVQYYFK